MSRGVLFDRGNRKRLKVSRFFFRALDAIETATKFQSFAGKAMMKGAFSHRCSDRASKRHRRALPYLFPMAALPRVFCCSEIREWNDPALVFWL